MAKRDHRINLRRAPRRNEAGQQCDEGQRQRDHDERKKFGSFTAVRNLNLQVPRGTIFGFLGPNGSGKSTTVKLLTGLLTPTAGEILITSEPVAVENVALKRKIGVLPEDDSLFRALTIWEHLEMSGPLYGLSHKETEARATQILRHLDLWRERGTYVEQASFGMRKKCALAMALLHNPRVLFLVVINIHILLACG